MKDKTTNQVTKPVTQQTQATNSGHPEDDRDNFKITVGILLGALVILSIYTLSQIPSKPLYEVHCYEHNNPKLNWNSPSTVDPNVLSVVIDKCIQDYNGTPFIIPS